LLSFISGVIAAIVAIVQFIVPDALVILLVSSLSESHSGVTWSAVGRILSNSNWPLYLRSDQTASQNVPRWVNIIVWVKPLTLSLIAVAAIVTPIGLYETIEASKDLKSATFFYIPDKGPMGLGTSVSNDLEFSRICGSLRNKFVCPGSSGFIIHSRKGATKFIKSKGVDYKIPHKLTELYQSGLTSQSRTVSSFFDIQSRRFRVATKSFGSSTYLVDVYRQLGTLILDDKIQAVEGLVVDTRHPKVGFRNHTAPTSVRYGAEWEEDLLFLEPETKCVDVNISLEATSVSDHVTMQNTDLFGLVDNGGFVNMNITSPWQARTGKHNWYDDTQENPALDRRAQAMGWSMNVFLAYFFNVTKPGEREAYVDSQINKRFPIRVNSDLISMKQIALMRTYDTLMSVNYSLGAVGLNQSLGRNTQVDFWPNPFAISSSNFTDLAELCEGFGPTFDGKANMTNIQVKCGLMVGAAQPSSGEGRFRSSLGWWKFPIYSCVSTTKATIKTVRFRFNATNNNPEPMKDLEVLDIADKVYSSRNEMPLWGVEDANMSIVDVTPLWGLIDPSRENSLNLSTVRAERLYLPAGQPADDIGQYPSARDDSYLPAITGPSRAWARVYRDFVSGAGLVDYSGKGGFALYNKWVELSQTAEGAAQILNLIFTDYAANDLVGTRSQLTAPNLSPNPKRDDIRPGKVPVHLYQRVIRYRWIYGIPAFLSFLVVSFILFGAIVALLTGRGSISRVKHYLWNLSAGRILAAFIYPGSSHMYSDTKEWTRVVGSNNITLSRDDRPQGDVLVTAAEVGSGHGAVIMSYHRVPRHEPMKVVTSDIIELRSASESMTSVSGDDESSASSTDAMISR
jgi:hypothetical protein